MLLFLFNYGIFIIDIFLFSVILCIFILKKIYKNHNIVGKVGILFRSRCPEQVFVNFLDFQRIGLFKLKLKKNIMIQEK